MIFTKQNISKAIEQMIKFIKTLFNGRKPIVKPRFYFGFKAPYRIGKKQLRAVLDSRGHEIVLFQKGKEKMAKDYCDFLNGG